MTVTKNNTNRVARTIIYLTLFFAVYLLYIHSIQQYNCPILKTIKIIARLWLYLIFILLLIIFIISFFLVVIRKIYKTIK